MPLLPLFDEPAELPPQAARLGLKLRALAALRGFFDHLVNRHAVILNPAASMRRVKGKGGARGDAGDHHRPGPTTVPAAIAAGTVVGLRDDRR